MWVADRWTEYELLDCGDGARLERWGKYILSRPDPVAMWSKSAPELWKKSNAEYSRSSTGGGHWDISSLPDTWLLHYGELSFVIKPMGFKHTGIFPEQASNWDWTSSLIKGASRPISVLNLFAYTGGATVASANAGASVCHVDAAKGIVGHARENSSVSGLRDAKIRWIVDDCIKFVAREVRRGSKYDAIIMDPPSYGRGPNGEVWKLETSLFPLITDCVKLLSDKPLFFLLNSYTSGLSPISCEYAMRSALSSFDCDIKAEELGIPCTSSGLALPCGSSVRCEFK